MELKVLRFNSQNEFTDGLLHLDDEFMCYTLEDEYKAKKKYGETRIPDGTYQVKLRKEGGFHNRYSKKFKVGFHKGMLHVTNVPGFEYILIHIGNTDEDTAGCLLVGMDISADDRGYIGRSTTAYTKVYPKVAKALEEGEEVTITYMTLG